METFLEILKYILPALVVFVTVYYLMRTYINGQLNLQRIKYQEENRKFSVPLRLQAYERLILLCERISVESLLLRLRTKEMNATELKNVMMLAVKQEYDHNLSQQLYVSAKLWEILTLAKNQVLDQIFLAEKEAKSSSADAYSAALFKLAQKSNPIATAKSAIVKEGQMYF
jgi:hypothetical protein